MEHPQKSTEKSSASEKMSQRLHYPTEILLSCLESSMKWAEFV